MKTAALTMVLAWAAITAGCTTTENSSRNLGDPSVHGKTLAEQVCSDCHGVTGNSINPTFPRLAGQQAWYLSAQLKEFRGHHRGDPAGFEYMWGISRSLTDAQIKELATYYAEQKPDADKPENTKLEDKGKVIFASGIPGEGVPACMACHGAEGAGSAQFPRIAGQHANYIVKQLNVFQSTEGRPNAAAMKVVAHNLKPAEIKAVAAYVSTIETKWPPHAEN
ncbi:MAG: c-type cytochrome [Pseudomonadota bacterium]